MRSNGGPGAKRPRREFEYYVGPGGRATVEREINDADLSEEEAAIVETTLDRVECGDHLPGDIKHLRGSIWEVRISGDRRIFRLLYAELGRGNPIFLGLVFIGKKSRKTPPAKIDLAEKRLASYREHH